MELGLTGKVAVITGGSEGKRASFISGTAINIDGGLSAVV